MSTEHTSVQLPQGITAVSHHGIDAFRIDTPLGTGLVTTQGAHVAQWTPAGSAPVLWMSEHSNFEVGKAIRGGIPVCFPWFGPGRSQNQKPAHGFARTSQWSLLDAEVSEAGEARLVFGLDPTQVEGFELGEVDARLVVAMGSALMVDLSVTAGAQAFDFEEALHTYLRVGDVRQVQVEGLDQASFLDKLDDQVKVQHGPVDFTTETDRVYFSTATTTIVDPAMERRIVLEKANSANTVVWNPWVDKAAAMADFGDDEWTSMCCVETVNCLDNAVSLAPGETHSMSVTITVEELAGH